MSQPDGSTARALAVGDELPALVKELTLERLIAYGGPAKNLHSDLEAARAEGFPSVVAWGMLSVAFVSELLGAHFGLGWARGGRLSVSLVKPVFAGNTVALLETREIVLDTAAGGPAPDRRRHRPREAAAGPAAPRAAGCG